MAAHAFHVIVLAPLIHTTLHVKSHIYLTYRQLTYSHITVHTCYSSCVNANSIFSCTFTFTFLSALKFISAFHFSTIFECISIFFCLFFSFPSFPFSRLPLVDLCLLSLNLQSHRWSAPVRFLMDVRAHCAPPAGLEAVRSPWWRWRRFPSCLGHASLNTLGSSTCFLSERQHRCGR